MISGWPVHWYGALYVVAYGVGVWLLPRLQRYRGLELQRSDWVEIVVWAAVGVLAGGRLGYMLLYEPASFWQRPAALMYLWQGGMASHGGFIGVAIALWWASKIKQVNYWRLLDVAVVPVALGLALGRIGNVINQEIFLTPLAQGLAVGKDVVIAGVCYWYLRRGKGRPGETTAIFLILYGSLRFFMEWARVQDYPAVWGLTRGQWYTVPIIVVGVWLYMMVIKNGQAKGKRG